MEWIIAGLFALFLVTCFIAGLKVSNLREEVHRLTREKKQSNETTAETLQQTDRIIGELNRNLRELTDHDAALQAKLEAMHMAAMRMCMNVHTLVDAGHWHSDLEIGTKRLSVLKVTGANWYRMKDDPEYTKRKGAEYVAGLKPTVDEWIEFANSISAHVDANKDQWQAKIDEDWRKERASKTSLEDSCLDLVFKMAYFSESIYAGEDHKQTRDLMLLEFLDQFQKLITRQRQHQGNVWDSVSLGYITSQRQIELNHLRGMLLDLMKHRNAEYMAILNKFPPAVAMEFLRLTVAEPAAAAG